MPALPAGQGDVVVVGTIFARLNVQAMLPTLCEVIDDWRPNLVVRESAEYASALAAESRGVRHGRVGIGLAVTEEWTLALAGPALEEVAAGIVDRIAASPYFTRFPPSLDLASFDVQRCREPAPAAASLPDWWPGDERPLVYVTFGSVAASYPGAATAYERALEAVADLPVRVLLTVGRELQLGPVPANVHVERRVPQADVLGHAAAVVCHGGSGTTLGAIAAGVPLVLVPLFADQPFNAGRVAGTAVSLDDVRRGLERVLEDDSYRAAAERLADEMRALPAIDDRVRELVS